MNPQARGDQAAAEEPFKVLDAVGKPIPVPDWLSSNSFWPGEDKARGIVLVVCKGDESPPDLIHGLREEATVLVFGAAESAEWRSEAMAAGAFACMSSATPREDRVGFVLAAIQRQAALREIESLHRESDRICLELVQSFASAMEKLGHAKSETQRVLDALESARLRILRTLV